MEPFSQTRDEFWWDADEDDAHEHLCAHFRRIENDQRYREVQNVHNMRLYSNRSASALTGVEYAMQDDNSKIRWNIIKAAVDAAQAQIAANRTLPMYLTEGGSGEQQKQAKNQNKFVKGQFHATQHFVKALKVFRDAAIFGTGFLKVHNRGGEICTERVLPDELFVDDDDAMDGEPRFLIQHKEVSKAALKAMFPDEEEKIDAATILRDRVTVREDQNERCSVIESWKLPEGKLDPEDESTWGKRIVAVDSGTLEMEDWKRDEFPFAVFRWSDAVIGWFGSGISEELNSIQIEINYLLQKIQRVMNLATTQVWMKKGEGSGTFDNQDMGVRTYKNTPPVALSVNPLTAEFYQHLDRLWQRGFENIGLSQHASTGHIPAQLKSGEAIRRHQDVATARFRHVGQRWEQFHLDAGELMLEEARCIQDEGGEELRVLTQGDHDVESINFADAALEKGKYITQVKPASALPDTPSGKVDRVIELAQMDPEFGQYAFMLLTDVPDLKAVTDRLNADYRLIEFQIESMLEDGIPNIPLPYQNIMLAQKMVTMELLKQERSGLSEERKELLRQYVDAAGEMLAMAQPPPVVPPVAPPPEPGIQTGDSAIQPAPMPGPIM